MKVAGDAVPLASPSFAPSDDVGYGGAEFLGTEKRDFAKQLGPCGPTNYGGCRSSNGGKAFGFQGAGFGFASFQGIAISRVPRLRLEGSSPKTAANTRAQRPKLRA